VPEGKEKFPEDWEKFMAEQEALPPYEVNYSRRVSGKDEPIYDSAGAALKDLGKDIFVNLPKELQSFWHDPIGSFSRVWRITNPEFEGTPGRNLKEQFKNYYQHDLKGFPEWLAIKIQTARDQQPSRELWQKMR